MAASLSRGWFILFAVVLILFRTMKKTKPERNKNPFSLIQKNPDKWIGLTGSDAKGFLSFDTVTHGVRAGFINLFNRYYLRGLDTIEKIFPVYAPPFENDTEAYIRAVCKWTGFTPDKVLDVYDFYALGSAIIKMEAGKNWVSEKDFKNGFTRARKKLSL